MPRLRRAARWTVRAALAASIAAGCCSSATAIVVYRQAPAFYPPSNLYSTTYNIYPVGIDASGGVAGNWAGLYGTFPNIGLATKGFITHGTSTTELDFRVTGADPSGTYVVGYSTAALVWSNGSTTTLGTLGGTTTSANAVNIHGVVVGSSGITGNAAAHAFLYASGVMHDLGTLGGTNSYATGVNASGAVVGYSQTIGDAATHAFLFSGGVMTDLGSLGGDSRANAINDAGHVTGSSVAAMDGLSHPFLYSGGAMVDLGIPADASLGGIATALNNLDEVVGTLTLHPPNEGGNPNSKAFLDSGGAMALLPVAQAFGINDSGQIAGRMPYACISGGCSQAFRLDPTIVLPPKSDADGDGAADLFWHNTMTGDVNVWFFDPITGGLRADSGSIGTVPDANWVVLATGDFDGDGKADLLWRNTATGEVNVWFIDATTMKPSSGNITAIDPAVWQYAGTGDFDHDGVNDIVWRNTTTGDVYVWFMDGLTIKPGSGFVGNAPFATWKIVGVGDFDGDLKSDLLWHNVATGEVNVWFLDRAAIRPQSGTVSRLDPVVWKVGGTGDFDADFRDDIVWRNATTGDVYLWYMDGLQWKSGSGIAGTLAAPDWVIGAVTSTGTVYFTNAAHDVGIANPHAVSYGTLTPYVVGNVGSAEWKLIAP